VRAERSHATRAALAGYRIEVIRIAERCSQS